MNPIKSEIFDSLLRMFGLCYLDEKVGKKHRNDAELQRSLKEARQLELCALRRYYESIKDNEEFKNDHALEILRKVFESKNNEIESAKRLLEKHGYKVVK